MSSLHSNVKTKCPALHTPTLKPIAKCFTFVFLFQRESLETISYIVMKRKLSIKKQVSANQKKESTVPEVKSFTFIINGLDLKRRERIRGNTSKRMPKKHKICNKLTFVKN
jgi:hypothetical protein